MRKILAASAALITLFTLSACGSDTANIPQCENEDGSGQAGLCYWIVLEWATDAVPACTSTKTAC